MTQSTKLAGECPPSGPPALSKAAKRKLRRSRHEEFLRSVEILSERERDIDGMKAQIREHGRNLRSYVGGGKDAR